MFAGELGFARGGRGSFELGANIFCWALNILASLVCHLFSCLFEFAFVLRTDVGLPRQFETCGFTFPARSRTMLCIFYSLVGWWCRAAIRNAFLAYKQQRWSICCKTRGNTTCYNIVGS